MHKIRFILFIGLLLIVSSAYAQETNSNDLSSLQINDDHWGPEHNGWQTQLISLDEDYVVGQPMRFQLVLKNVGPVTQVYDDQGIDEDVLLLKDENGNQSYWKRGFRQTLSWGGEPLEAGEIHCLFTNRNITNEYVIIKSGKYTIQFRGHGEGMSKDSDFPSSNTIVFEVKPGTPRPEDVLIDSLRSVVPNQGWELRTGRGNLNRVPFKREPVPATEIVISRRSMSYAMFIELWQTAEITNETKYYTAFHEGQVSEYLGRDIHGKYIYIYVPENVEKVLPSLREDISAALGLVKK